MNSKKAFSMLMTLLVIIVFSLIVMLGLKMSSLQLESRRYFIPMIEFSSKSEDILKLFKKILKTKILECPKNISIKYNDRYEMNSSIVYFPSCHTSSIGNQTTQIIVNMKFFDNKDNLSNNIEEYVSHK